MLILRPSVTSPFFCKFYPQEVVRLQTFPPVYSLEGSLYIVPVVILLSLEQRRTIRTKYSKSVPPSPLGLALLLVSNYDTFHVNFVVSLDPLGLV